MRDPVVAYIGLGANLGRPAEAVCRALARIGELPHTRLVRHSSLYRSAPLGASGPDFVNAVAEVETGLSGPELLARLRQLEQEAGRVRPYPNAPRTLDLDVLLFGDASISSERLQVPHPRMHERAFVLVPLAEIAPERVLAAQLQAVSAQALQRL
jgi:2-amino-4-hydroxy-6-hydroxymethyldihydropteridine diphosphokinase